MSDWTLRIPVWLLPTWCRQRPDDRVGVARQCGPQRIEGRPGRSRRPWLPCRDRRGHGPVIACLVPHCQGSRRSIGWWCVGRPPCRRVPPSPTPLRVLPPPKAYALPAGTRCLTNTAISRSRLSRALSLHQPSSTAIRHESMTGMPDYSGHDTLRVLPSHLHRRTVEQLSQRRGRNPLPGLADRRRGRRPVPYRPVRRRWSHHADLDKRPI